MLKKPITSETEAETFFNELHNADLLFHPDDNPADIVKPDGTPLFTPEECSLIEQRIAEVRIYMLDPCEYIVDTFYPTETDETRSYGPRA